MILYYEVTSYLYLMNNWELADKQLQRLQKFGKLKWDKEKKRWNKKFYPITDNENNFIQWKFGEWGRLTCWFCGKLLETIKENPSRRASKYCKIPHAKAHQTIITRAMKKFNLKKSNSHTYNPKIRTNWIISIPPIYKTFRDKQGKLRQEQIKDRVESKDVKITINGKTFPYTTKARTPKTKQK